MKKIQMRAILKIKAKELGWASDYDNKEEKLQGIPTQALLDWIIGTIYAQDRIWHGAFAQHAVSNFIELLNAFGLPDEGFKKALESPLYDLDQSVREHVHYVTEP